MRRAIKQLIEPDKNGKIDVDRLEKLVIRISDMHSFELETRAIILVRFIEIEELTDKIISSFFCDDAKTPLFTTIVFKKHAILEEVRISAQDSKIQLPGYAQAI